MCACIVKVTFKSTAENFKDVLSRGGWLSWPCWLTDSGRLTHKVIIRPASSLAQDRESSPVKDQRSTTVLAANYRRH